MGKQINFFMTPDDEDEFCRFVLSESGVVILPHRVASLPPPELSPPLPRGSLNPIERELLLWNRSIFRAPDYAWHPAGFFSTAGSMEGGIEFTRSVQEGNVIRAGRLWTEAAGSCFHRLDGSVRDPNVKAAFDRWLNGLLRWIRKHYVRQNGIGFYVGPGALGFQEMGGELRDMSARMDDPKNIERRYF